MQGGSRCASAGRTPRERRTRSARRSGSRATYRRSRPPRRPAAAMRPAAQGRTADVRGRRWKREVRALTFILWSTPDDQLPTAKLGSWELEVGSYSEGHGDARRRTTRTARPTRGRVFRPSAWPLHVVLHRDVGALQLLRNARVPHL